MHSFTLPEDAIFDDLTSGDVIRGLPFPEHGAFAEAP
jgi:hypothetical protein